MLTRRRFLKGLAVMTTVGFGFGGYAFAEPFRLNVTRHRVQPRGWPDGFGLKVAVIADLHVCEPWMSTDRVHQIVARTNALAPDIILLLGDYVVGPSVGRLSRPIAHQRWAPLLGELTAPLGVHAVLGNHDWWDDRKVQVARSGTPYLRGVLERAGIAVYENEAVRLTKAGQPFWLAGLGDQWAFYGHGRTRRVDGRFG